MKSILTSIIFILFFSLANAQTGNKSVESPGDFFDKFQSFTNESSNPDSAFYYIKKLASNKSYKMLLESLVHNLFAQTFRNQSLRDTTDSEAYQDSKKKRVLGKDILMKIMADTTRILIDEVRPIYILTEIQDKNNDPDAQKDLTNKFIQTELVDQDIYLHRAGRYGLMIYQVIARQPALKSLSEQLFNSIKLSLQNNQINYSESLSRAEFDKRAWYRYMYAYVNYEEALKTNDIHQKEILLKRAFDFSPDLIDKNHASAYFYDMHLLLEEEKEGFGKEYLDFLTNNVNDKKKALTTLLQMALLDPTYKAELRTFYENTSSDINFNDYWLKEIHRNAKTAEPILLNALDEKSFSSKDLLGKWILIDFWGTWCGPCRKEHPDLQKFYESKILPNKASFSLLTIACRDQKDKVLTYMNTKKFSFPVAMADNQIEKTYAVQAYPTKILITPEGKYVTIPLGIDWVNFVSKYSSLD